MLTPSLMGFRKARLARSGQVPILGVTHNEIENVLASRKLDDGGVTHSAANPDYLIRIVAYQNH